MTVFKQLHNSATHKVGLDPACPMCIEKFVTGKHSVVKVRQRIEIAIAMTFVEVALAAGYKIVGTDNGGGELEDPPAAQTVGAVLDIMFKSDDDRLYVEKDGRRAWVWFIYGNEGWDVISD